MSALDLAEPIRTCVGCRTRRGRSALVRITRSDGGVVVDGPGSGRGAWLCRSEQPGEVVVGTCLDAALARRGFARAWRAELDADVYQEIRRRVAGSGAIGDEPGAQ